MRLLRPDEVPAKPDSTVFRESVVGDLVRSFVCWLLCVVFIIIPLGIFPWGHRVPMGLSFGIATVLMIFAGIFGSRYRSAQPVSDWLVRIAGETIYLKPRSLVNLSATEISPQVIELAKQDIVSIRKAKVRTITNVPGDGAGGAGLFVDDVIFLEINMNAASVAACERALQREQQAIDENGSSTQDFPVSLSVSGLLRICWRSPSCRITPGIRTAIRILSLNYRIVESAMTIDDFSAHALKKLSPHEQALRLKKVSDINWHSAVETVRALYGCSDEAAQSYLERL